MVPIDTFLLQMLTLSGPLAADVAPPGGGGGRLIHPLLILGLCVIAGVGTVLLLPGRFSVAWRRIGGTLAILAGAALFLTTGIAAETRPVVYFWAFAGIALLGSLRVITHPKPVYSALYFVLTVFASAGLFVLLWAEFMAVALVVIYAGAILVTYTFVIMLAADAAPPEVGGEEAARDFLAEHDRQARTPVGAAVVGFVTMGVLLFVIFDRAPAALEPRLSLVDPVFMEQPPIVPGATGIDAETVSFQKEPVPGDPHTPAVVRRGDLYPANDQPSYANERGGIQTLGIFLFTRQMLSLQIAGLILTVAMIGAIVIARRQIIPELRPAGLTGAEEAGETMTMPFTPADDDPKSLPVHGTSDPRQKAYPQN